MSPARIVILVVALVAGLGAALLILGLLSRFLDMVSPRACRLVLAKVLSTD